MKRVSPSLLSTLSLVSLGAMAQSPAPPLTVVEPGGVPADSYYRELKLKPTAAKPPTPSTPVSPPTRPTHSYSEADALPVKSPQLSPGTVEKRAIRAPGLVPFFIVGNDARSRMWLREHYAQLRALGAAGMVVNVDTLEELRSLRLLAPDLTLAPSQGDDIAQRLDLSHYPALITSTAIEQ
jgi:integrating conjugative element protein (TIGR03765 family)